MLTLRAAVAGFLGAALLVLAAVWLGAPATWLVAHAMLAVGALPLMMAAVLHFVPVLSRTGAPHRILTLIPWVGMMAGLAALLAFLMPKMAVPLALTAASVNLCAAVALMAWTLGRRRRCLGAPHPGLFWYLAALGALAVAMLAALGMVNDPGRALAWRRLHLHLNLFGWIGLTVLGTLPVLLPTALREFDAEAAQRLRRLLPWAGGAVVLLAAGAMLSRSWLAGAGALGLMAVLVVHVCGWWRRYRWRLLQPAAVLLTAAVAGLLLLLMLGTLHVSGILAGARMLLAFIVGFLLPLVSGALAHLLPVWWHPGANAPPRQALAIRLIHGARGRATAFFLAGGAQYLGGFPAALGIAVALAAMAYMVWLLCSPARSARV